MNGKSGRSAANAASSFLSYAERSIDFLWIWPLIGSAAVASADPDGSTFLISSIGTHVTSPATSPNPAYDPLRLVVDVRGTGVDRKSTR